MTVLLQTADFSHYQLTGLMSVCKSTRRKRILNRAAKLHLGTSELRCNESAAKWCYLLTLQSMLSTSLTALSSVELVHPGSLGPACLILCLQVLCGFSQVLTVMPYFLCVSPPVRTDCSSTPLNAVRGERLLGALWLIHR